VPKVAAAARAVLMVVTDPPCLAEAVLRDEHAALERSAAALRDAASRILGTA
jgi:hypothetical protein